MATVIINSGAPEADDRPDRIPKDKWRDLMWVKRDFAKTRIKYDCRCLLEFVQDAEIMWQELGFESAEDMICNGYELDMAEVDFALAWLELKDPGEAVPFREAVKEGRKIMTKSEAGKKGNAVRWGDVASNKVTSDDMPRGNRTDYLLARLARDHPDILSDYELGRYKSVRAAAIAAGIVKVQSPYEMIGKQLAKLNRLELMDLQTRITAILQEQ